MKTKLLKKVRRDYNIVYYPEGYKSINGDIYLKNAYVLFFKRQIIRAEFDKNILIDHIIKHIKGSLVHL